MKTVRAKIEKRKNRGKQKGREEEREKRSKAASNAHEKKREGSCKDQGTRNGKLGSPENRNDKEKEIDKKRMMEKRQGK